MIQHVSQSVTELLQSIRVHPDEIIQAIGPVFGVEVKVLLSKDRHQTINLARMACALVLRRHGFSYPEIGRKLKRDHTSMINSVDRAKQQEQRDQQFRAQVCLIEELIRPKYLRLRIDESMSRHTE